VAISLKGNPDPLLSCNKIQSKSDEDHSAASGDAVGHAIIPLQLIQSFLAEQIKTDME